MPSTEFGSGQSLGDLAKVHDIDGDGDDKQAQLLDNESFGQLAQDLIRRLGSPKFLEREEATLELWKLGPRVEPFLIEASTNSDRETRARVNLVLERFKFGIFPDTPANIVRLIERYRTGSTQDREQVVRELISKRRADTLERLYKLSEDPAYRTRISSWILGRFDETMAPLILDGEIDTVIRLMLLAADDEEEFSILARILIWEGRLDETIELLENKVVQYAEQPELPFDPIAKLEQRRNLQLFVMLLRAQGDHEGALAWAEQIPSLEKLPRQLMIAAHDWQAWAEWENVRQPATVDSEDIVPSDAVESLAFAVFANHLAGNNQQRNQLLETLREQVANDPSLYFFLAEAYFATDQFGQAIELIRERDRSGCFEILCAQHRYDEAFALVKLEPTPDGLTKWIKTKLDAHQAVDDRVELYFILEVLEQLAIVGEDQLAKSGYEQLAQFALDNIDKEIMLFRETCRQEREQEYTEQAEAHLRKLFQTPKYQDNAPLQGDIAVRVWFSSRSVLALFWWGQLRNKILDPFERIESIELLFAGTSKGATPSQQTQELLDLAAKNLSQAAEQRAILRERVNLAETYLLHKMTGEAAKQFELAFAAGDSVSGYKLAHLKREAGEFEEAILWYDRAYEKNRVLTAAHFYKGICLEQLGRQAEADAAKKTARLLSLPSPRMQQLADSLRSQDLESEAAEILRVQMQSAAPMGSYYSDACGRLGNTIYEDEPVEASSAWRQVFIGVMKTERNFVSRASYLSMAELIHHGLAIELLNNRNVEAAWPLIQLCLDAQPGNTQIAEDFVPLLEDCGEQKLADEIYDVMWERYQGLIERFPNSALHHNNLAWFSARCERNIDIAHHHSQIAVKLDPQSSNYLDTLAEIVFLQGDAKQAYELAKKCVQLNPTKAHYQKQLERFRAASAENE